MQLPEGMSALRSRPGALLRAAAAIPLIACGDDDATPDAAIDAPPDAPAVTAADYAGLWLITEMEIPDGDGTLTLRRDGVAQAIRGDAVFTPGGETTGALDVRQVALIEGLIASPIFEDPNEVTVEPDRWLVRNTADEVVVFLTELAGDHLVLTHDPTDPRDTQPDPPDHVIVDRVPAWSTDLVGSWDLVSMTTGGTTYLADQCIELSPATMWGKLTMDIEIEARLLFTRVLTLRSYSDDGCTVQTGEEVSTQFGYGEAEPGALRMWAIEEEDAEYQEFAVSIDGDTATLTRGACLPLPDCTESAPTEVVVERASP
jgi:hypothetical protein